MAFIIGTTINTALIFIGYYAGLRTGYGKGHRDGWRYRNCVMNARRKKGRGQ